MPSPDAVPLTLTADQPGAAAIETTVEAARRRLDALADRLRELRPDETAREDGAGVFVLLDWFERFVFQARRLVEDKAANAYEDPLLAISQLGTIRRCVNAIERACSYDLAALLRRPGRDVEPLIGPFTELARTLSGRVETELVFEATEKHMYSVQADAFDDLRDQISYFNAAPISDPLPKVLRDLPPLGLIAYPVRADGDTLAHAVIAHEVAHLALLHRHLDDDPTRSIRERAFEELLSGISTDDEPADGDSGDDAKERLEASRRRNRRLRSWLDELACDLIAIRSIGPAYFFALVEFTLPRAQVDHYPGTEGYDSHPSVIWRLERMAEEAAEFLDRGSKKPGMVHAVQVFDRFTDLVALQRRFAVPTSDEEREERQRVLSGISLVERNLVGVLGDARYTAWRYGEDLELVWDKLEHGIPPVERIRGRGTRRGDPELPLVGVPVGPADEPPLPAAGDWSAPVDWRSILNGCYVLHLSGRSAELEGETEITAGRRRQDNQMCRGSIELAEYNRRMLVLREQFRHIELIAR